jgi:hypothetical protein
LVADVGDEFDGIEQVVVGEAVGIVSEQHLTK